MSSHPFRPAPARIVVTGGPGAGKTAVLELARRQLCQHVEVLPESASIVFGGGFPRRTDELSRRAAQRAIYHVQHELETIALGRDDIEVAICDRGTIDGLAYWPGAWDAYFDELHTTLDHELMRYAAVLHLRVPDDPSTYYPSGVRTETHAEAREIDRRLLEVWAKHPRRTVVEGQPDFLAKAARALAVLRAELPARCCAGAGIEQEGTR